MFSPLVIYTPFATLTSSKQFTNMKVNPDTQQPQTTTTSGLLLVTISIFL